MPTATRGRIGQTDGTFTIGGSTMADERPLLDQINLVVSDMDASLAFYRRVGVDFPAWEPSWDRHHRSAKIAGGGYRGQQPPYDAFWGSRYAVVEDPDGNLVGLMGPMDDSRRREVQPPP